MWVVVVVAGCVSSVLKEECAVGVLFCHAAGEIAFSLFGYYIGYYAFFGFKVVAHCLCLILGAVVFKNGVSGNFACRVGRAYGINGVCSHVEVYFGGCNLLCAVFDFTVSVQVGVVSANKN